MKESPNFGGVRVESSRATEGNAPHCTEGGRGDGEENGGQRSEGAEGSDNAEKVGQIWMAKGMNGFKGV